MFDKLLIGIYGAFSIVNVIACFIGVVLGIIFGALPGFTATMGVSILLPVTFGMEPVAALVLLAAIYCGAVYGGSITAILLHTPGTPAAAMTAVDGYILTQKGRSEEALDAAVVASFWGGIVSAIALLLIGPPLARFTLQFGPAEILMIAIFGLTIIASLSADNLIKGVLSGLIGLLFGSIGMDPYLAFPRFSFGQPSLIGGISLVPALIGLFSISQVLMAITEVDYAIAEGYSQEKERVSKNIFSKHLNIKVLFEYPLVRLRSALIGLFVGMLPGAGSTIAAFLGYNEGKRFSKNPEKYGKGSIEAVNAAEAANNGVTGGALITMMTLGIPGSSVTAVMLGGLMMHGLKTGHNFFSYNVDVSYPFMIGLIMANIFMLLIGYYGARLFIPIIKVPINLLTTVIVVLAVIGSFAINNNMFDVYVMIFFGLLGYLLKKYKFDPTAVVLGIILSPIIESRLTQTIIIAEGRGIGFFKYIFDRPICIILVIMIVMSIIAPYIGLILKKVQKRQIDIT